MKTPPLLAVLLPSLVSTLVAQTPDHLVGITRFAPSLRHQSHTNCGVLHQCPLPGMVSPVVMPAWAGGTAWDPVRSGAWVSNGVLLGKFDDNCAPMCPPAAIPSLGTVAAVITGLEVVVSLNELWMIDSAGRLHFYTNTCPPNPLGVCNANLVSTSAAQVTTGLAVDELREIVFIAHPDPATGINWISVSRLANPCQPISRFQLPPCFPGFGLVSGLACDWASRILYATDGTATEAMQYGFAPPFVLIGPITCCPFAVALDQLVGLAVRPGRATSIGTPCNNGSCPNCPMNHSLINDPVMGNAAFRLGLDDAPHNSFAFCMIGNGPCNPPGVGTPPLCGPIYTLPFLGYLGPNFIGGSVIPCAGSTSFNLPLPVDPALANLVFSSQCLNLCVGPGGALGFALSNCLSWRLQGN